LIHKKEKGQLADCPFFWKLTEEVKKNKLNIGKVPSRWGSGTSLPDIRLIVHISLSATMDSRRQPVIGNFSLGFYF
jgi:hypothetical protein